MAFAAEPAGAQTPPPPTEQIHTPPAPRFGYHDSWEPFAPRKSARLSSQRAANRTPSPRPSARQQAPSSHMPKNFILGSDAPMASPMPSPRKRSHSALEARQHASASLTAEGTAQAAAALGLGIETNVQRPASTSVSHATGMLPTPSKTPQKPPNQKTAASIQSFARNLFAAESEEMPFTPRRRSRKHPEPTMKAKAEEVAIEIFTDSHDRIPEKDSSEANPFFSEPAEEPSKRRSNRRWVNIPGQGLQAVVEASGQDEGMIHIPGEGLQAVKDASARDDGMICVFRGKKYFCKFDDQDENREQGGIGEDVESRLERPLTRASVKPRLLFPPKKPSAADEDDEEATTDIEDMNMVDIAPQTPTKSQTVIAKTPDAPRFAPASPPQTKRTTRSTNKLLDTPMKVPGRKSPFDSWPRTKEPQHQSPAPKRAGESLHSTTAKKNRA